MDQLTWDTKSKRCQQIREEIKRLGYSDQNNFLIKNGHTDIKKNVKSLKLFNGDQTKALDDLTKRAEAKKEYSQDQTDYSKQNEQLVTMGYTKTKHNLNELQKYKGDLTKVLDALKQKQAKKDEIKALDLKEVQSQTQALLTGIKKEVPSKIQLDRQGDQNIQKDVKEVPSQMEEQR